MIGTWAGTKDRTPIASDTVITLDDDGLQSDGKVRWSPMAM